MKEADEDVERRERSEERDSSPPSDSNDGTNHSGLDDDDGDLFHNSLFGSRSPLGLQSTLRALSGMMTGMSSRLREILCNLRAKDDPSIQLIALQELSDLLLVSNEDNLSGQFSPDPYVKELVSLMQPNEFGEENPEIMLLACRCLANLMEALRGSVANVVYGGAVPILCQKLLDIQFIDLAEQALSTLAKISVDFPASIVREGGLTACLTYLDFFPTSTQRTAVTTAANCCRNLPHDSFPVVRDVMPTLLNVLSSNDPKVMEQGCLCVSRIVESFKHKPEKLEELIEPAMLKAVLRLLLPGTTNLIGPHIHTQFLRVLAIVSKASPRLSVELLKMNVVDTLYQILTGVSPPGNLEDTTVKMDSVLVMQALIHRPREQVLETLNVICEMLPGVPGRHVPQTDGWLNSPLDSDPSLGLKSPKAKEVAEKRRSLLLECQGELKRFAMILLPTLTDAYSSTVNLEVRQKVLIAQLKMLHHLDAGLVEEALRSVPYASFLAAILSQKDHPSLVSSALRCSELLFQRLEHVYQYQFHREGVVSEVFKLAEGPLSDEKQTKPSSDPPAAMDTSSDSRREAEDADGAGDDDAHHDDYDEQEDERDENDDMSESDSSSLSGQVISTRVDNAMKDLVIRDARTFVDLYEASHGRDMREKAIQVLTELRNLASNIEACYSGDAREDGLALFEKLAAYFDGDALESITSSELLNSGIIKVLLDVFGDFNLSSMRKARAAFLQAFMGSTISEKARSQSTATTPFSVLIQKLQDLLSRTEHFEVLTVSHNSLENTRSNAAHMLGKQLRLKLVADEDSDIPRTYRSIMVSIHAIATFKALDDFLHPRISLVAQNPAGNNSLATAGRPFSSYAAAMASIPSDWHLEFSVDGNPITGDTTIYRAVHHNRQDSDTSGRHVWSAVHTVKFRRVPGPPPPEPTALTSSTPESAAKNASTEMPPSLSQDTTTASILQLLRLLHEMNATLDDIVTESKELVALKPEALAQFINTKLTAKLNRQLEEPLIVASSCLPSWSEDLARLFPFLFPFETRHLFLQSTAFGYSRAMMRWHNSQNGDDGRNDHRRDDRPFLGRLQRQKVRISRSRILESAMKVMELYGSSPSVLEVEYFEEVGTGLGPTLEFYSTVSKEFSKKKLKIWRENDCNDAEEFAFGKRGLFPAPMSEQYAASESGKKQLHLFKVLGKFVARSMLDSRIIDVSFNPAFFRIADSSFSVAPSLGTVKAVDQDLANSLLLLKRFANAKAEVENKALSEAQTRQALLNVEVDGVKVEDLSLDFTLPGYPSIELIKDGSNVPVTIENVDLYVERVVDMTLSSGVQRQVEAFREGFSQVFPYSALRTFTPAELVMLFGRAEEDWSIETLMDSIKADHGFNMDSRSVRNLLQTMSELDAQQRRDFLQFVTGSPKLPIGGFKSLTPIFTVVCRPSEPPYTPDDYLPSVMTCVNYLKLPDYSSLDVLRTRLSVAIQEGQGAFHLS
ncbi:unnamed protein product [Aspergillus oryzae RIB40]|uniref:HECT-type E3 ubiquitin transferase n=1 Tax=Aspergillus oryzae (strain ATCC 42149 / RIB 40) TaxID=510516 RepID=Q2UMZ4_ASPOR|nr:unnamed protein product [Aspergillus oryzae RIB40]BAE57071.1 unnamed protein product [Aspergillus oryzae RIB40]